MAEATPRPGPVPMRHARIGANVLSGLVVGLVTVAYSLSFGALVFRGPLEVGLGVGIAAALIGAAVSGVIVALTSSFRTAIGAPDTPVIAVFSALAAGLAVALEAGGGVSAETAVDHVMISVMTISIVVGAMLWFVGLRRLGHWLRFVPYPVIGGFVAASGWFLSAGSVRVVTGTSLTVEGLDKIVTVESVQHYAPAVLFALALAGARRVWNSGYVMPLVMVAGMAVAHLVLLASGTTIVEAQAGGWLLAVPGEVAPWIAGIGPETFTGLDLGAFARQAPTAIAVGVVAGTVVLLTTSSLELANRTNVDLDREYRASGIAYMASGLLGGFPGNTTPNRTLLAEASGGTGPLGAIVASALCLAVLAGGSAIAGLVPTAILGGILLYMGVSVILGWAREAVRRMSLADGLLVGAIFFLIIGTGYLTGTMVGIVAACILFAVNYARVPIVRQWLTRRTCSSYVERPLDDAAFLVEQGDRILVAKLQGYIFFGSANRLLEQIVEHCSDAPGGRRRWLILEFSRVPGVDSSAAICFTKLGFFARRAKLEVRYCGLRPGVAAVLAGSRLPSGSAEADGLDRALEACEEALLAERPAAPEGAEPVTLERWLAEDLGHAAGAAQLARYCRKLPAAAGDWLCRQGGEADEMYFVLDGRVSVLLEAPEGPPLRLRSMVERTLVGEMGFFAGGRRSASVRVEVPSEIYALSRDDFAAMRESDPVATAALAEVVIRRLADRLGFANAEVAALQRD